MPTLGAVTPVGSHVARICAAVENSLKLLEEVYDGVTTYTDEYIFCKWHGKSDNRLPVRKRRVIPMCLAITTRLTFNR